MTLQELLKSLNLTDEQITSVNSAVDTVINSKLTAKESEIQKLQGDLKQFKAAERNAKIKGFLPKDANAELYEDILALSGIKDEDSDEEVSKKFADTISKRDFLKVAKVTDPAGVKTVEKSATPANPVAKKADSKINQTAMSNL